MFEWLRDLIWGKKVYEIEALVGRRWRIIASKNEPVDMETWLSNIMNDEELQGIPMRMMERRRKGDDVKKERVVWYYQPRVIVRQGPDEEPLIEVNRARFEALKRDIMALKEVTETVKELMSVVAPQSAEPEIEYEGRLPVWMHPKVVKTIGNVAGDVVKKIISGATGKRRKLTEMVEGEEE